MTRIGANNICPVFPASRFLSHG